MMCAGWIRFRASLMATRRISSIDQRINDELAMLRILPWFDVEYFLGGGALARWPIAAIIEGEHYKRNVRFQPCQDLLSWALSATVLAANDVAVAAKRISTLFSTMNLRALLIAADVSVASSGTTYSTTSIRTAFGSIGFCSIRPADAMGPVRESTTPTLTSA